MSGISGLTGLSGISGISGSNGSAPTGITGAVVYLSSPSVAAAASTLVWDSINSRLGVGTATPTVALQVYSSSGTKLYVSSGTNNTTARIACLENESVSPGGLYGGYFEYDGLDNKIYIGHISGGTDARRITLLGEYIGIGATNPVSPLQINCGNGYGQGISFSSAAPNAAPANDFMIQRGLSVNYAGGTSWNSSNCMIFHTPNETIATTGPVGYLWMSSVSRPGMFYDVRNSRLGIGTVTPYNTLDVYGSQITRNITTYNNSSTSVPQWYNIGLWNASVGTGGNNGQRLRLEMFGGNGYDGNSAEQWGGVTTIYATIMNLSTGSANCGGFWQHEGSANPCVSVVKFVQNSSNRNQYYVYVYLNTYTQYGLRVETTQGSAFTPSFTSTTDPGADSSTVREAVLSYITAGQVNIFKNGVNGNLGGEIRVCAGSEGVARVGCYEGQAGDTWGAWFQYNGYQAGNGADLIQIGAKRNAVDYTYVNIDATNGNVGLGNIPGTTYKLNVSGTIGASGDITALYSDERLKTKTGDLSEALTKVCSLDTFTYVNNDLAKSLGFTDELQRVGVSAQQVQKVLPEAVRPAPFDADNKSGQNYLTVQYEKLVPLLIEALKEERQKREAIEERLTRLEKLLLKE